MLRIGCVRYLNARPLTHGLPWEARFDHPGELCRQLAEGKLDVALVSSFEFLRNPIYCIVDDLCIASRGPVYSVFVAHQETLSEVDEIAVDPNSRTAVNLLRCLLEEMGLNPQFTTEAFPVSTRANPRSARLLIGDQAIHFREDNPALRYWDLGEEWEKLTALPFVYALWLIRPEVPFPEQIGDSLRLCRDRNLADIDSIVRGESEFAPQFCADYIRRHLRYHFGPLERAGLERFRTMCISHRILAG